MRRGELFVNQSLFPITIWKQNIISHIIIPLPYIMFIAVVVTVISSINLFLSLGVTEFDSNADGFLDQSELETFLSPRDASNLLQLNGTCYCLYIQNNNKGILTQNTSRIMRHFEYKHNCTYNIPAFICQVTSCSSVVERPLMVLHDWCNKGHGICYPVCGMVHIKEPLLLIGKSSPCGGSGLPLSLSDCAYTI